MFIRGNFTSDSNAMAVIFFREFAAAEAAVGNIFSHDNAVVQGQRVAQMATTIHRPDVGYSGTCVLPPLPLSCCPPLVFVHFLGLQLQLL